MPSAHPLHVPRPRNVYLGVAARVEASLHGHWMKEALALLRTPAISILPTHLCLMQTLKVAVMDRAMLILPILLPTRNQTPQLESGPLTRSWLLQRFPQ